MTDPASAGSVTFVNTMRFYRHSRTYRIWGSVLWGALFCVWVPAAWMHSARHPWQPWVWIVLILTQFASLWTYWDITADELIAHSFGFRNRYRLSAIDGIDLPDRRLLAKTVRVEYRGRRSLFITVADKAAFEHALRQALASHEHEPPTTGPLGLSV